MGLSDFMAQTEAQSNIVTFGRDLQTVTPTTLEITENGEYDVRYYAKVDVNVEGNPNYKEVLTGTANKLELPDGLNVDIGAGDATAYLSLDLSALSLPNIYGPLWINGGAYALAQFWAGASLANCLGFDIEWAVADGTAQSAKALMAGNLTDMSAYLAAIPYELTVYHHKMPEDEDR